jgi:hypothetical protein
MLAKSVQASFSKKIAEIEHFYFFVSKKALYKEEIST